MLSGASFGNNGSLLPRTSRLCYPEPAFRSGFSLAHDDRFRAAIMRSRFPTYFFNASLNFPQARSACGSFADAGLLRHRQSQHRPPVA